MTNIINASTPNGKSVVIDLDAETVTVDGGIKGDLICSPKNKGGYDITRLDPASRDGLPDEYTNYILIRKGDLKMAAIPITRDTNKLLGVGLIKMQERQQRELEEREQRRRQNLPQGYDKISAVSAEWTEYFYESSRAMETGYWPKAPRTKMEDLKAEYPLAYVYHTAVGEYMSASNDRKVSAGRKVKRMVESGATDVAALQAILDGWHKGIYCD